MVEAIQSNPYGNIYQYGVDLNGRILYNVIDSNGKNAGKLSLKPNEADIFEHAYKDIIDSAVTIQKYTIENSSENAKSKRKWLSRGITTTGGILGAASALLITNKSFSTTKKILGLVTGIVSGLSAGFIAALAVNSPPETLKFVLASHKISKLDIRKIE